MYAGVPISMPVCVLTPAALLVGELRDAEVEQLDLDAAGHQLVRHEEDVVGLEIAVNDAALRAPRASAREHLRDDRRAFERRAAARA